VRVRSRLLLGVLLTGAAVVTAGAPSVHGAASDLMAAQELVEDAGLGQRALSLSHILADERDTLVVAAAHGGPEALAGALTDDARARADRAAAGLADAAGEPLSGALEALPTARENALSGASDPAATHLAYTEVIEELDAVFRAVSRARPGRAADPTGDALPDLARAVHASAATRGLLLAALTGDAASGAESTDEQVALASLARQEATREAAALADFAATAGPAGLDVYERTVTGSGAEAADAFLAALTDAPTLSAEDRALDPAAVEDALLARTDLQRGVLSSLATERIDALKALRGSDLTRLQVIAATAAAALIVALVVSVHTARSLTRPLAAVRLGTRRVAADPAGQQPVKYTGRNDEFAEVVASVNALRARTIALQEQAARAVRDAEAAARDSGGLRAERDRLLAEQGALTARLAALHGAVHGMFAHHAQRLLALVDEQLSVIVGLEEHEADPDRLAVLFSVDHLAARMRRHGENLLLLAGAEPTVPLGEPMPLIDVARAAVSEIEHYELVETVPAPPPGRVAGLAARDVSHLLAELLDNATAFSPPGARVRLTARWIDDELLFCVEDEGVGLSPDRLAELNARLADPVTPPPGVTGSQGGTGIGMGLYTVARLAVRHGLRCWLAGRPAGGTLAQVIVPAALVQPETGPYPDPAAVPVPAPVADPFERYADHHEHARAEDTAPRAHGVTGSGLPLRTPAGAAPAAPEAGTRARAVDAEELRRRLGGFQRGARDGHRDAARAVGPYPGETGEESPS
jgi:signal transduction histidine kinase